MISNPSSDKALWYYTAAFLADLDARSDEAWKHIQEASKYPASDYLKGSIRIMKMYLDAKVSPYDKDYEERLSQDLIWIDRMITGNITAEVCNIMQGWESYKMRNNISFYYWNDMMRRILLAEICPRMLDRGMPVRALQLANMADHRLLMLFDIVDGKPMSMHRSGSCRNYYDYRNDFFEMMQYTDPQNLGAYIRNMESSTNDFDVFLKNRGYVDYDYFKTNGVSKIIQGPVRFDMPITNTVVTGQAISGFYAATNDIGSVTTSAHFGQAAITNKVLSAAASS